MKESSSFSFGYHPIRHLLGARLREFVREPAAIFWVYIFPLIMVITLGIAFRNRPVETATVDVQEGSQAQAALAALSADDRFVARVFDQAACRRRLRTGKTDLIVIAASESNAAYQYVFDPSRPGGLLARNAVNDVLQRAAGRKDVLATHDQQFSEPGGRYIDFLVPGLVGMGLMGGGLWGVGFATVDMRIRKLLKRFLATPMKKPHFLFAMMTSRFVFMVPEVLLLLLFSRIFFGVIVYGNYLAVVLLIVLGAFEFAGIGLLVASRAQTLETVSGLMNLVMLPMWIGSGIFFSVDRFPEVAQPVIALLPLTPLISALRAVMLEGATLSSLGVEIGIISAWGVVTFVLALRWFRWN